MMQNKKQIEYNGKTYSSKNELYRAYGVSKSAMEWRLSTGLSLEQALGKKTRKRIFITHNGQTLSIKQWSQKLNINEYTIKDRFKKGWTSDRILAKENQSYGSPRVYATINGETLSLREWSKRSNIPYWTLRRRNIAGWSDDILLCSKKPKKEKVIKPEKEKVLKPKKERVVKPKKEKVLKPKREKVVKQTGPAQWVLDRIEFLRKQKEQNLTQLC